MIGAARLPLVTVVALACGIAWPAVRAVTAQAPNSARAVTQSPAPEGYVPRGTRPQKGLAPGMRVADLGKGARTFRVNFAKGDEIMSGMTEFAEKYHIRNGHFTGLGA